MKKWLLGFVLALACSPASAQCVAVGGVNNVPVPGLSCLNEPLQPSYAATGVGVVAAAAATDVACLTGSATRVIRVQQIRIGGTATTAISVPVLLMKRATADTGGTAATGTALPVPYSLDSTMAAATATTIAYTANPTVNDASPGIVDSAELSLPLIATGSASAVNFDYQPRNYVEAITLRGVAQQLCVNLNATSPAGNLLNVTFRWTELTQ